MSMSTTTTATVAAPPDATRVSAWDDPDDHAARRYFTGATRVAGPATVGLQGWQRRDGAVTSRSIYLDIKPGPDDELDPATARAIAAALMAAASELDERGWARH